MKALNHHALCQFSAGLTVAICAAAATADEGPSRIQLAAAHDIIGLDIRSGDGKEAGEIEYLLIDSNSTRIRYALIGEDGELELADDEYAVVPFSDLDIKRSGEDDVTVRASLKQLRKARRIQEDGIAELTEPLVITEVYDYYATPEEDRIAAADEASPQKTIESEQQGQAKAQEKQGEADANETAVGQQAQEEQQHNADREKQQQSHMLVARDFITTVVPGMRLSDAVLGADVRTADDDEFGELDQLIVDINHNRVAYALVAHGGFLGIGEEWYAVPMQQLVWTGDDEAYWAEYDGDAASLKGIPKSDLPTSVRVSQLDEFYNSFGLQPYLSDLSNQADTSAESEGEAATVKQDKGEEQKSGEG